MSSSTVLIAPYDELPENGKYRYPDLIDKDNRILRITNKSHSNPLQEWVTMRLNGNYFPGRPIKPFKSYSISYKKMKKNLTKKQHQQIEIEKFLNRFPGKVQCIDYPSGIRVTVQYQDGKFVYTSDKKKDVRNIFCSLDGENPMMECINSFAALLLNGDGLDGIVVAKGCSKGDLGNDFKNVQKGEYSKLYLHYIIIDIISNTDDYNLNRRFEILSKAYGAFVRMYDGVCSIYFSLANIVDIKNIEALNEHFTQSKLKYFILNSCDSEYITGHTKDILKIKNYDREAVLLKKESHPHRKDNKTVFIETETPESGGMKWKVKVSEYEANKSPKKRQRQLERQLTKMMPDGYYSDLTSSEEED